MSADVKKQDEVKFSLLSREKVLFDECVRLSHHDKNAQYLLAMWRTNTGGHDNPDLYICDYEEVVVNQNTRPITIHLPEKILELLAATANERETDSERLLVHFAIESIIGRLPRLRWQEKLRKQRNRAK